MSMLLTQVKCFIGGISTTKLIAMISTQQMKKILPILRRWYNDQQVKQIRDYLYELAQHEYENYVQLQKGNTVRKSFH